MRCKLRYVDVCNPAVVTVIILCGLYGEDKDINSRQQIINLRSKDVLAHSGYTIFPPGKLSEFAGRLQAVIVIVVILGIVRSP